MLSFFLRPSFVHYLDGYRHERGIVYMATTLIAFRYTNALGVMYMFWECRLDYK